MDQNTEHFWTLLKPEHERLRGFCRRIAGDRDRGDDLCQEALLLAIRRFHTLRDPGRFRPWIYQIVLNRHRNLHRSSVWKWFVFEDTKAQGESVDPSPQLQARRTLEGVLHQLSAEERALITLFEVEDWRLSELSELFGRSENALKVRLSRIRSRLRADLNRTLARRERLALQTAGKEPIWIAVKPNAD